MQKYKSLHRTTLDKTDDLPLYGIYVLAYMGKIVYIGQTTKGIGDRLSEHVRANDLVGEWIHKLIPDWANVRLDVLEPPDEGARYWLNEAEAAMINYFTPLFNELCNRVC